ncbi:MAG TPA: peroxiredoxin [Cellvibrionaceae bacterium]
MKSLLVGIVFASFCALPAFADKKVGESARLFKTQASLGGKAFEYELANELKKGPVIVYFYPTAFGGGCSIQAHEFAVNHDKFLAAGATVVGVSLDDIGRLNEFSANPKFCASKFPVASDTDGTIARAYGLTVNEATKGRKDIRGVTVEHGSIDRTTFIVGRDGKIAASIGDLKPAENVAQALTEIKKITSVQ